MNKGWLFAAALGCALLAVGGCTRSTIVTKQMTWECAPEEYKPAMGAPAGDYVRFRYVEEPRCFEVESSRNFCARMQALGKRVVSVQFDVHGGPGLAARGYHITTIEGQPLISGPWGNAGVNGDAVCPIGKVIDSFDWTRSRRGSR